MLHAKLADICGGEAALVTGSGMAAITTALLALLKSGDHLLIQDCLYGGTHSFVRKDAPDLGISCDFIAGNAPETWAAKLKSETKAIYVETMSNPLLEVADLEAVVAFPRAWFVNADRQYFCIAVQLSPIRDGFRYRAT